MYILFCLTFFESADLVDDAGSVTIPANTFSIGSEYLINVIAYDKTYSDKNGNQFHLFFLVCIPLGAKLLNFLFFTSSQSVNEISNWFVLKVSK